MSLLQSAQFPLVKKDSVNKQEEIVPETCLNVQSCIPLGNTSPGDEEQTRDTRIDSSKTPSESESKVRDAYNKNERIVGLENTFIRSKRDEKHFDNLHREASVGKTVTLKVENGLMENSLEDPDVFVISGKSHSLFLEIGPRESDCFLFAKTPWSLRGAVGMCTFRIQGTDNRLAIYFCNPIIGHNSYGLTWIKASESLKLNSYHKLFNHKNKWLVRDTMKNRDVTSPDGVYVARTFMTQGEHVKMDIKVLKSQ